MTGQDPDAVLNVAESALGDFEIRQKSHAGDELLMVVSIESGKAAIRRVEVTNAEPGGVTPLGLRQVAAGAHRFASEYVALRLESLFQATDAQDMSKRLRDGRKKRYWTRERLTELAQVYIRAQRDGQRPRKAVVEHYGMSPSRASVLIREAREAGIFAQLGETD